MVILPDTPLAGAQAGVREPASRDRRTSGDVERRAGDGHRQLRDHRRSARASTIRWRHRRADTALYRAKQRGRNGIELEEQPTALAS